MKKMRLFLIVFIAISVGALGVSTAAVAKEKPIKIGFMGNLSSPATLSSQAAAKLAVSEMNFAGGILGRHVELIIEDTKGEIPKSIEIYKKLVMYNKVDAVVIAEKVEMGVAGMEIGAELFREFPHIMFSTIGSGDTIWHHVRDNYDKYKFGFQTYYYISTNYLNIMGKEVLPNFFKETVGTNKVAIIYEDMEWTKPLRKGLEGVSAGLRAEYEKKGMEVVYEATLSLDQKVFSTVFEEIAASGAGVMDCVVGYIDQGSFIKQWAQSSAKDIPWFIWGGLAGMPVAWKMTEGKVAGGSVGSSFVKIPITEKTIPFMDDMVQKYKTGPIFGSHTTYDTLNGYKKAVEQAGGTKDIDKLIKSLEQVREVAVLGTIGWDPQYHYNLPYPDYITPIVQWQNGEMVVVQPLNIATGKFKSPKELRK